MWRAFPARAVWIFTTSFEGRTTVSAGAGTAGSRDHEDKGTFQGRLRSKTGGCWACDELAEKLLLSWAVDAPEFEANTPATGKVSYLSAFL